MQIAPVYEAKNRFSELLAAVEQGEIVSITRRGAPAPRLVAEPAAGKASRKRRANASLPDSSGCALRAGILLDGNLKVIAGEGAD